MDPRLQRAGPYLAAGAVAIVVLLLATRLLSAPAASESPSPSASQIASTSPSAAPSATSSPSASASASPNDPTPAPTASSTPTPPPAACAVTPETGELPTDRVVSVEVSTSDAADFVTFVFDTGSLGPAGPPQGELLVAEPPFTYAASGLPLELDGQRAIQVRMSNMSLYNDVGEPTYTGERDIKVAFPALKQVVMYDESEGYAGWYIGYDGPGCVDLVRDGTDVVLTLAHE
jgi:hypothetical protein